MTNQRAAQVFLVLKKRTIHFASTTVDCKKQIQINGSTSKRGNHESKKEHLVERHVTYTVEHEGQFYIVENVPARVDEETGEQYFAPSTVERLQQTILGKATPDRVIETPVYDYSERAA